MKYCPSCKRILPDESFTKDATRKDGLSFYCGNCCATKLREWRKPHLERLAAEKRDYRRKYPEKHRQALKKWQSNNLEYHRKYHRELNKRIRKEVFEMYGNKCACCGESHYEFLVLDHINGGGGQHRRRETHQQLLYRLKREGISPEYRLLCSNCNFALAYYGFCPHNQSPKF